MKENMITIPAIIGTALVTATIVGHTPAQQDRAADPVLASINLKLEDLGDRVSRIEHATNAVYSIESSGELDLPKPPDTTHAPGGRCMIIDNIQTSQFSPDYSGKIADLEQQAASLEQTLDSERRRMRDIQTRYSTIGSRGGRGSDRNNRERELRAQRSLMSRYTGQLSRTNTQIKKLSRAMNELTQIIHGHEGDTIITLQTQHDLSSSLNAISTGDYVTWTGRRIDMTGGHESWTVSTVRLLESTNTGN